MKRIKALFITLTLSFCCFQSICIAGENEPQPQPQPTQHNKYLDIIKNGPRSANERVLLHYVDGQMWFDLPNTIEKLTVTVWHLPTGNFIESEIFDNTPFDVPFTEGTLIITCTNDEGLYGEGTIEL